MDTGVDNSDFMEGSVGDVVISHIDRERGEVFLTKELTFSSQVNQACRFFVLKSDDSAILNGDRVTLNTGSKVLSVSPDSGLRLISRDAITDQEIHKFTITEGRNVLEPLRADSLIFLMVNPPTGESLRYLITEDVPRLTVGAFLGVSTRSVSDFRFKLRKINSNLGSQIALEKNKKVDGRGLLLIALLTLFLFLIISKESKY